MDQASVRRFVSPLRYPGGKGKIANFVKLLFLKNSLVGSEYVEVYAGGAGVALALLFEEYTSHVHINDFDPSISTFWSVVLNDSDELCSRIMKVRVTPAEWQRQRDVQLGRDQEPIDLAFSTFFLNRTSRSGILKGGLIGGRQQNGTWRLDARFDKTSLVARIKKIARFRNRITVTAMDGADYIRDVLPTVPDPFVYLDPPYFEKGQGLYPNAYGLSDHAEVAKLVKGLRNNWIVSYDQAPEILRLYKGLRSVSYTLNYTAADRYRGREIMFFSPKLVLPGAGSPAGVRAAEVDAMRASC